MGDILSNQSAGARFPNRDNETDRGDRAGILFSSFTINTSEGWGSIRVIQAVAHPMSH